MPPRPEGSRPTAWGAGGESGRRGVETSEPWWRSPSTSRHEQRAGGDRRHGYSRAQARARASEEPGARDSPPAELARIGVERLASRGGEGKGCPDDQRTLRCMGRRQDGVARAERAEPGARPRSRAGGARRGSRATPASPGRRARRSAPCPPAGGRRARAGRRPRWARRRPGRTAGRAMSSPSTALGAEMARVITASPKSMAAPSRAIPSDAARRLPLGAAAMVADRRGEAEGPALSAIVDAQEGVDIDHPDRQRRPGDRRYPVQHRARGLGGARGRHGLARSVERARADVLEDDARRARDEPRPRGRRAGSGMGVRRGDARRWVPGARGPATGHRAASAWARPAMESAPSALDARRGADAGGSAAGRRAGHR